MNRLDDFADETGIYGLNLMRQRIPKTERILWLSLTIIFTAFTIRDLRIVIKTFMDDETLTSVTLNDNEPITFDPPPVAYLRIRESFIQTKGNISNDALSRILKETFAQTMRPDTLPDLLFDIN